MNVVFQRRDFTTAMMPELDLVVEGYSKHVIGGARRATVQATGSQLGLFELLEFLRAPVVIYNEFHEPQWWGFVNSISISWQGIKYGISLDTMSNSIAIAYTDSSVRNTTAYSANAESVAEYGTKQMLLSRTDVTEAIALQLRDTELQARRYPVPTIGSGNESEGRAVIDCRGWLDTLDWQFWTNLSGKESYEALGQGRREVGEDDRPILAMSFQLSAAAGWTATTIWMRIYKVGAPADNLVVSLYSDAAGDPSASLSSCTIAGGNITTQMTWTEFEQSVPVALSTGTVYHIHVARSGAIDLDNYYVVGTNRDNGYANGGLRYYNTNLSAWVDANHKGHANFMVMGDTATTAQITTLIAGVGEFVTSANIETASGVTSNPYRFGDNTALYELQKLLATGTTNDRRLLCEVTRGRVLRVYEESAAPTPADVVWGLRGDGSLISPYGNKVLASDCPVGMWCRLVDVVPASVDLSKISDPTLFFVEEAEYDAGNDRYYVTRVRHQTDVFQIGGVR